jgi:ribonucleoside-diphosphate reductase alpha chain
MQLLRTWIWVKKVEMQGRVQQHIDHSISVTVNLPENIDVEKVNDVYMTAWKSGCKGITVYRDGSRGGVLNTKSKKDESTGIKHNDAPKRPEKLPCDVYHVTAKAERWTVLVGLLEDDPYEVFAIKGEIGYHRQSGLLHKKAQGVYDLIQSETWENVTEENTDEEAALTRMISTSLRHGSQIKFVVEQLNKAEGSIVSFSKAIARTLKRYVNDNEMEKTMTKNNPLNCPNDGQDCQVVYEEGCMTCKTCGTSKCT